MYSYQLPGSWIPSQKMVIRVSWHITEDVCKDKTFLRSRHLANDTTQASSLRHESRLYANAIALGKEFTEVIQ
jgi:hypothetical protein